MDAKEIEAMVQEHLQELQPLVDEHAVLAAVLEVIERQRTGAAQAPGAPTS